MDLKKLYQKYPECFEDSAKFKALFIDQYPEEKKARINVLTTLLEEGVMKLVNIENAFDDDSFCNRICDDYGYQPNLVRECIAAFSDIRKGKITTALLKAEKLLKEVESLPRISILKTELSFLDLFCQDEKNNTSDFLPYTEEKEMVQTLAEAEKILETAKEQRGTMNLSTIQKICDELEAIAAQFKEVAV